MPSHLHLSLLSPPRHHVRRFSTYVIPYSFELSQGPQHHHPEPSLTALISIRSSADRVFSHALFTVKRIPRTGSSRPPTDARLKLYGLYKQSTEGNVSGLMPRPVGNEPAQVAEREKWYSYPLITTQCLFVLNQTPQHNSRQEVYIRRKEADTELPSLPLGMPGTPTTPSPTRKPNAAT